MSCQFYNELYQNWYNVDSASENDDIDNENEIDIKYTTVETSEKAEYNCRDQSEDEDYLVKYSWGGITKHTPRGNSEWTPEQIDNVRTGLFVIDFELLNFAFIKSTVLNVNRTLTTECLDAIIYLVQQKGIEVVSVAYNGHCNAKYGLSDFVPPASSNNSLAILGNTTTFHWRLARYDGKSLYIYDTLSKPMALYADELTFIKGRFPKVTIDDIQFPRINSKQPGGVSCGVYAGALLVHGALGDDLTKVKLSRNVKAMRECYWKIVDTRKLIRFPTN